MNTVTRICSVAECNGPVKTGGMCNAHYQRMLRARKPKQPRKPRPRRKLGDVCRYGHIIDANNWVMSKGYMRCRICHNASKRRRYDKVTEAQRRYSKQLVRLAEREDVATADDEKPTAPWNLLRPKPLAREAWAAFSEALNRTKPSCHREPGKFTDYADEGEEPEDGQQPFPTSIQAAQMCSGCPLVQLCRDYARLDQPVTGVWAGEVWVQDEKLAYRGKRRYG